VQSGLHPDLFVLLPEDLRRSTGWLLSDDKGEGEDLKRKPSRQIRITEVRALIDWSHTTSARGRGKLVVLHPADALNYQSASALLKTLEEPPAGTRLLLTTADPAHLLPTVRSRCQRVALPLPAPPVASAWLAGQGVSQPEVLLAACNGRPLEALALVRAGIDAAAWTALPGAVTRGQVAAVAGWPAPLLVDALQKLCHDALAVAVGGAGVYFPASSFGAAPGLAPLLAWAAELGRVARHAEHPWSEALLADALVQQGRQALAPARAGRGGGESAAARGFATLPR
jgi:DNA polymerase-3 subunit delta'